MIEELTKLNQRHLETLTAEDERLQARIANYELAFRMQTEIPDVIDCDSESEQTLKMYGVDEPETNAFGRQCLLARRLVENGVRFVQIFSGGWDSHDYLKQGHTSRIKRVDKPMAGLIRDLHNLKLRINTGSI